MMRHSKENKWMIIIIIGFGFCLAAHSSARAADGGSGDEKGAHNQKVVGLKQLACTFCHFSESGEGIKIWPALPQGAQTIPKARGIKTICSSCHYPGNAVNARSGFIMGRHNAGGHDFKNANALCDTSVLGVGENHVMGEEVEIDPNVGKLNTPMDTATFPLKTTEDKISSSEDKTNPLKNKIAKDSGFDCITCHDPHNQPNKDISGHGDYLRVGEEKSAGNSDQRTVFCLQCHGDSSQKSRHGVSIGCNQCHHPHDGYYQSSNQAQLARSILVKEVIPVNFGALPNVVSFDVYQEDMYQNNSHQGKNIDQDTSALCYGCHGPSAPSQMRQVGAKAIFGDDSQEPKEHHPMGYQAQLGKSPRAPGLSTAFLNKQGQVTCISCHDGFHRGKNLHFLRQDFTGDKADLCTLCHTNKSAGNLGSPGVAHHQTVDGSPNQRGQCMFCHFIHDGPNSGDQLKPSINALLRIEPVNLSWSDQKNNKSKDDFEDLCFGCHSSEHYMNGTEKKGARLQPEKYFSHRFSSIPSDYLQPTLPISDGELENVVDDYGTAKGEIYCGSCHDIHQNVNKPYLRGTESPYASDNFCSRCHTAFPLGGQSTHPTGVTPKPDITVKEFPQIFCGGKSGSPRGITSDESPDSQILCLTCHSMHAAATSFDGHLKSNQAAEKTAGKHGKLLILDNFSSISGSDLCRSCHILNSRIADSRHDFSSLDLSPSASLGVCGSCHVPHGSREANRLWARDLTQEKEGFSQKERPNYRKDITILCYDCHDDHSSIDDDPPLSAFFYSPQDIAFSDGPGRTSKVGFYETIPPGSRGDEGVEDPPTDGTETGGHYIKTASLTEFTNGINTGDKIPCNLCHNPHKVTQNEAFLLTPPGSSTLTKFRASRNSRYGKDSGREICASCHGYSDLHKPANTPVRLFGVEILKIPDRIEAHKKSSYNTSCTDCHGHNRMAVPASPGTGPETHAFHFKSLLGEESERITPSRKLFTTDESDRKCDVCHPPELPFRGGKLVFNDGKTFDQTTVCDICHSQQGQYDGVNGYTYTITDQDHGAKDCWGKGVYEDIINENGYLERQLRTGKDTWCIGCHDNRPSAIQNQNLPDHLWVQAPNIAGDEGGTYGFYLNGHGLSENYQYRDSIRSGAGLICTDCHSPKAAHIVNEQRGKGNFKAWQDNAFRLKLPMTLPRRSEEYHSSDFTLCFSCHEEASVIGLPPGYRDYSQNHNPCVNLDIKKYPVTRFSNADARGIYPIRVMGRGIKIDFSKLYPSNSYNIHWNHLALPNADLPQEAVITPQAQQSSSNVQRTQSCFSNRCHGETNLVKEKATSFWDSDKDGKLDSRPSCTACHNPHGSRYVSMTRNDLAITHNGSGTEWEYGFIGSKEYGIYTDTIDNFNDLYCGECHATLERTGSNVIFYPQPLTGDLLAPDSPQ